MLVGSVPESAFNMLWNDTLIASVWCAVPELPQLGSSGLGSEPVFQQANQAHSLIGSVPESALNMLWNDTLIASVCCAVPELPQLGSSGLGSQPVFQQANQPHSLIGSVPESAFNMLWNNTLIASIRRRATLPIPYMHTHVID